MTKNELKAWARVLKELSLEYILDKPESEEAFVSAVLEVASRVYSSPPYSPQTSFKFNWKKQ